ncbi:MAG: PHP domain-containing protein [Spiribacter sp.]|jgi:Predicted metal-dependent phosphoesterases (PHP family)|nr:PHP domain-containing protein [Spiribacter sp.]MDR9479746.1 PHP domain-containing protein [Spiribacter sp.]
MPHSLIDLHMHSTASDGRLTPIELVDRVAAAGVALMALTDHDTLAGLDQAQQAAGQAGVGFVPGIELSARWARGVVHIVGLGIDPANPVLVDGVAAQQARRHQRAERIGERLVQRGFDGIVERVNQAVGAGVPGRAHFARDLLEQGHVSTMQEAFDRYLKRGRPGYAPVDWASIEQVVEWIHAAGGVAVFAHPLRYDLSRGALRAAIQAFVAAGGDAIEVSNGGGGRDDVPAAAALARRFGLEASMGSDFHDPAFPWIRIGALAPVPGDLAVVWRRWPLAA